MATSSKTNNKIESLNAEELNWIQLREEIGSESLKNQETFKEKFNRKFSENPFVPIGCLATAAALTYGLWSFRHGRPQMSQKMMRLRIAAQGFTVVGLMVGVGVANVKENV
ncbi:hypothetical protein DAPPUDRAFT_231704 [Daphnia pulex]|uniref:HIG1 domain-containing protein n=1 Tax=Daphnia pulex TaxID=6669 RepID=E9HGD9_DAPPU|nr:hypothetical protein DAPPUDRAFT_231704 [Daphnia pulex]|eukprot:EFX69210.1 hypothetical protein DAPPUDRAFT_231704 [Daphnia pulex]